MSRKLGAEHFAFMRSLVQGVPLRAAWDRYLSHEGEATDARLVRSTVAWIRDAFAAAARREHRHGTARLVRADLTRLDAPTADLPTLEAFAHDTGLEDYSYAEQLAAYETHYGRTTQSLKRRGRLVARQLEALRWLEALVAKPPQAEDAVAAWLHPALAKHLERAGIFTLAQLVERINGIGKRWYAAIPSLGPTKAERVLVWLRSQRNALEQVGLVLGGHTEWARSALPPNALNSVVTAATEVRPLEKLVVPDELDGRLGVFRRPVTHCRLALNTDREAVLAWIRSKTGRAPAAEHLAIEQNRRKANGGGGEGDGRESEGVSHALSNTQRAYRKEAERLLLWAILHRGKALSSLDSLDCVDYLDFLADPQPRERWCGLRARERWSPLWRPFEGPLSVAAQRHAVNILRNLFGFLVAQGYLMANPWVGVGGRLRNSPSVDATRRFSDHLWSQIQQCLDAQPTTSTGLRLRLAVRLLYATGMKLSEVVAATVADLHKVEHPPSHVGEGASTAWMLRVAGKGREQRMVPVPPEVIEDLLANLVARGLSGDLGHAMNRHAHLLARTTDLHETVPGLNRHWEQSALVKPRSDGLASSTLYKQLKAFFQNCADRLVQQGDRRGAEQVRRASTQWLRHTHAHHAIAHGVPVEVVQRNLGHASLGSTHVYLQVGEEHPAAALEVFRRSAGDGSR